MVNNERLEELKKDFYNLKQAKTKEVKGASVKMIEVERLINSFLEKATDLDDAMLLKLYYYLRGEYIEAFQYRRAYERSEKGVN